MEFKLNLWQSKLCKDIFNPVIRMLLNFFIVIDIILIKERNMNKRNRFKSKNYGDYHIDGLYNKGCVVIFPGKFNLNGGD
jgi:hypothetical protein